MKLLVVGGSYFLGRVFVMLASKEHTVTVVNRGNQSMAEFGVEEIRGDRCDAAVWKRCAGEYDVIVDFCAYREGDIRFVLDHLAGSAKQYIFISTVDAHVHGTGEVLTEESPLETKVFPGAAGDYISGKVVLEQELKRVCEPLGIQTTVLRPVFIYGPYNYAPRESVFIQLMVREHKLVRITGADGKFQFLYVKDGAEAVLKCLLNPAAYGQSYNLCGDEIADYSMFADALRKASDEPELLEEVEITVPQAEEGGFPLPYETTRAGSQLCSNEKSKRELGMTYLSLEEGMSRTYRAFANVYRDGKA